MGFNKNQDAYTSFRSIVAERSNAIVAWVGAGLSVPAGLPTWQQLRDILCERLRQKAASGLEPNAAEKLEGFYKDAKDNANLWASFSTLKRGLGRSSYRDAIRQSLAPAARATVPECYRALWKLNLSGMLTLNLDRLASRAYSELSPGRIIHQFTGSNARSHLHVLKGSIPFVANLHGLSEDVNTWVFTQDELRTLTASPGYKELIEICLGARTVLFVGITADDVAAGGHLAHLTTLGIDVGTHYWITDRKDIETDRWAENAGIRVIRYQNADGSHAELDDFFADLHSFMPADETPAPIKPIIPPESTALPPVKELLSRPAEELRILLNQHAARILSPETPTAYQQYADFRKEYDEAIYRAWFVAPNRKLLNYHLDEQSATGSFGTVYRATDAAGKQLAIKVLHESVRNRDDMVQSFRRGVRSMSILSAHKVAGVVPYIDACEIPAFAVMEFVEGSSLTDAVRQHVITDWARVLRIATDLTQIIRASHKLPERVLHRDIRPSNIMLRNCWPGSDFDDIEVVVLDFDLSWHRDAIEVSIVNSNTMNGYLAPEQVYRDKHVSTRNAAVDSYGLGMTLFFLRTGNEPAFAQHRHSAWDESLLRFAGNFSCDEWRSLPNRYFRLIKCATLDQQSQRWDMSTIEGEITRLQDAFRDPSSVKSAELIAEEVAARSLSFGYRWDADHATAKASIGGTQIEIRALESKRLIEVDIRWDQGNDKGKDVRKWLPRMRTKIESEFRSKHWKVRSDMVSDRLDFRADLAVETVRRDLVGTSLTLSNAVTELGI